MRTEKKKPKIGTLTDFIAATKLSDPHAGIIPFALWDAQRDLAERLPALKLAVWLKARQLGISWIVACAHPLWHCLSQSHQTWILFSKGLVESQELIARIEILYQQHRNVATFPAVTERNKSTFALANGSRVLSLAATEGAGRTFAASGIVLDEFAFMRAGPSVFSAVKPTIDAGGFLHVISTSDGAGDAYHQMVLDAHSGTSQFQLEFLPWHVHPKRDVGWRDRMIAESPSFAKADVVREYPATIEEAFTRPAGLIYGEVIGAHTVDETANYDSNASTYWAVDDGFTGAIDPSTRTYTAASHPRVILILQERGDGTLDVVAESFAVHTLEDAHIAEVISRYGLPEYAVVDKSAASLKGHLNAADIATVNGANSVEESIKTLRGMLALVNGRARIRIHPRCVHLIAELYAYRRDAEGRIIKAFDHGLDALRYFAWHKRIDA